MSLCDSEIKEQVRRIYSCNILVLSISNDIYDIGCSYTKISNLLPRRAARMSRDTLQVIFGTKR